MTVVCVNNSMYVSVSAANYQMFSNDYSTESVSWWVIHHDHDEWLFYWICIMDTHDPDDDPGIKIWFLSYRSHVLTCFSFYWSKQNYIWFKTVLVGRQGTTHESLYTHNEYTESMEASPIHHHYNVLNVHLMYTRSSLCIHLYVQRSSTHEKGQQPIRGPCACRSSPHICTSEHTETSFQTTSARHRSGSMYAQGYTRRVRILSKMQVKEL